MSSILHTELYLAFTVHVLVYVLGKNFTRKGEKTTSSGKGKKKVSFKKPTARNIKRVIKTDGNWGKV